MISPSFKALLVSLFFTLVGVVGYVYLAPHTRELVPHIIFYGVLVVNTFFSVRLYSQIQPLTLSQLVIDGILVITYVAVGLSLGRVMEFAIAALVLFAVAPLKYALMLGHIPHAALLRRKVRIDLCGTASCLVLLIATMFGYTLVAAWLFALGFAGANIYLLIIRPMYRLPGA